MGKGVKIMKKQDINIIRELASQVAEIAALSKQEQTRNLWRAVNRLKPDRPTVMIDQVCWNEMNVDDELTLRCQDEKLREWECYLRRTLYTWKHMPADYVVDDFIRVPKAIYGLDGSGSALDMGVHTQDHTLSTDTTNDVLSRSYVNQFKNVDDLEKIKMPIVSHDEAETKQREAFANEVFDGILDVRMDGVSPYLSPWDTISQWMGIEAVLYAIVDTPELMLAMAKRIIAAYMTGLDQLVEQGLLCHSQSWIHCTGAWADDLPGKNFDPAKPTTQNIWMFGLAQMFSTISPSMFYDLEVVPNLPLFERFGLVYYGCCDPLDRKMDEVRKIPNLRKVSISPWADTRRGAAGIGRDYVLSYKPNPALLAMASFDEGLVRKDLSETVAICKEYGCPLEIIMKDISTVKYEPKRLWRWAEIAMECVNA